MRGRESALQLPAVDAGANSMGCNVFPELSLKDADTSVGIPSEMDEHNNNHGRVQ